MIADYQQMHECHATGHQVWSALLIGKPGQTSFLSTPCSGSVSLVLLPMTCQYMRSLAQ